MLRPFLHGRLRLRVVNALLLGFKYFGRLDCIVAGGGVVILLLFPFADVGRTGRSYLIEAWLQQLSPLLDRRIQQLRGYVELGSCFYDLSSRYVAFAVLVRRTVRVVLKRNQKVVGRSDLQIHLIL